MFLLTGCVILLTTLTRRGAMGHKAKRTLVGVRLPETLARALKVEAARRGTTVQALVEEAVRAFLRREG